MKLEEVLTALRSGKKVRRKCWTASYIDSSNWEEYAIFWRQAVNAEDWEVVGEENQIPMYTKDGDQIGGEGTCSKAPILNKDNIKLIEDTWQYLAKNKVKSNLRAQAAIAAMTGVISRPENTLKFEDVAELSIWFADALLKKLEEE